MADYESLVTDIADTTAADPAPETAGDPTSPDATPPDAGAAEAAAAAEAAKAAEAAAIEAAKAPSTREFQELQRAQRKIHAQAKAIKDSETKLEAERATLANDRKVVEEFRSLAARAEDDPYALLDSLGVDRAAFFDALTRKALGEAPSADDRVNRLERELKARTEAEAKAKAEAEESAKKQAAEEAEAAEEAFMQSNVQAVAAFLEHDPDAYPVLRSAGEETEGLMLREVVTLAKTWKDTHGELLPMPKACEQLETALLERSVQRIGKYLESPKLRQRLLETFKLQPIPPSAPAPTAPVPAPVPTQATEPANGRPAGVRPPTVTLSERDRIAAERQARYESLVKLP